MFTGEQMDSGEDYKIHRDGLEEAIAACKEESKKHDCDLTDNIVCPWCGFEDRDSWDYEFRQGKTECWCADCGKEITVFENISVSYTSHKGHEK